MLKEKESILKFYVGNERNRGNIPKSFSFLTLNIFLSTRSKYHMKLQISTPSISLLLLCLIYQNILLKTNENSFTLTRCICIYFNTNRFQQPSTATKTSQA